MFLVDKKFVDSLISNSLSEEEEEYVIYPEDVDLSGVPRILVKLGHEEEDYFYEFPQNDVEVLKLSGRSSRWNCGVDRFLRPEIYAVKVESGNCTVDRCLELLKRIGRENRFIACSVESARRFFADLNKEDADKLNGLNEIHSLSRCVNRLCHM